MMLNEEAPLPADKLPVAALRSHLRMGSGFDLPADPAEDAALAGFLRAAIAAIEARTGKVLLRRAFRLRLADWRDPGCQPLSLAPVASVETVSLDDGEGRLTTLPATRWRLRPDDQRPMLEARGGDFPPVPEGGSVEIHFTAGFGVDWAGVPADLAQAVMMLAARFYEDRGGDTGGASALPFGVASLVERWRAVRTLAGRGARR